MRIAVVSNSVRRQGVCSQKIWYNQQTGQSAAKQS